MSALSVSTETVVKVTGYIIAECPLGEDDVIRRAAMFFGDPDPGPSPLGLLFTSEQWNKTGFQKRADGFEIIAAPMKGRQ